jgi:multiple sugar transport system permease protein
VGRGHDQGRPLTLAPVSGAEIGERRLPRRASRLSHDVYLQIAGLALIGPAVVALGVLIVGPFVYVAWQSLFALEATSPSFDTYRWFLDFEFWGTLKNGLKITVGSVALELFVAIPLALLLNRPMRGRGLLRGLVTLPWAVPTIAVASAFLWLASPFYGLFNQLGLWSGVLSEPISVLGDPRYAIWAVTIATAWKGLPLVFILIMSSLQSLDPQFIEAARVDGAARHAQFRHVLLPHLRSSIALAGVLSAVYNFSLLDLTFLLTGGGPAGSTTNWPFLLYNQEFDALDTGRAAAVGVSIFLAGVIALAVVIGLDGLRRRRYSTG